MLKNILSYRDFIGDSILESLDPFIKSNREFKIGETVKVNDRIGKITSIQGDTYLIMIDSYNRRVKESDIEKLKPSKKHKAKTVSKKLPVTRELNI